MNSKVLIFLGIIFIIIIVGAILFLQHPDYTYENFTSTVTDKYVNQEVSYVYQHVGGKKTVVPQYEDVLYIITENGTFEVDADLYKHTEVGDSINLTKNLNTSFIEITKYHKWR